MNGGSLTDRVAIITGASSGIGRAIAQRLASMGATIVVADIRETPRQGERFQQGARRPTAALVAAEHGVPSRFIETDTSDPDQVQALIARTVDAFDVIDILVNNAGILRPGTSQEVSVEDYERVIDVNLNGYFYMVKYAIPYLQADGFGRIVNVSSVNARYGGGGAAYAASKAGIVNMTRDLAVELADENVTANAVLPGVIQTPLQDVGGNAAIERRREATPHPRLGTPRDVSHAVAFFVSEAAEWITGAELVVDGGYLAGRP